MKRVLLIAVTVIGLGVIGAMLLPDAHQALAASKQDVCEGVGAVTGGAGCATAAGEPTVDSAIDTVVDILSILIGVISVIMIIVGGFKYVISGGDSAKVSSAKNTIIFALVGVVVAALAQTLVKFVLQKIL